MSSLCIFVVVKLGIRFVHFGLVCICGFVFWTLCFVSINHISADPNIKLVRYIVVIGPSCALHITLFFLGLQTAFI